MGIEPLSSAVAMQVQSTVKAQPVETKSADVNKDVAMAANSAVPQMDATTKVVARASEGNTDQNQQTPQDDAKTQENIKKAVDNLNKQMQNTSAIFGIHDGTNRVTIKIVDKETKEVIKELPPEKTLDMIAKAWELAGMLVDEKR